MTTNELYAENMSITTGTKSTHVQCFWCDKSCIL